MQAAWLRRFSSDAESNLRAFALRLREAMPDRVTIHETKGLFARKSTMTGVTVRMDDNGQSTDFTLGLAHGRLHATIAMVVRGITLNTKDMEPGAWFARLSEETGKASAHAQGLSQSINDFMQS
jgi:hypothetical protein